MASARAWHTTSASLWPPRPPCSASKTPPSTRGRPSPPAKGWTSNPKPTLVSPATSAPPQQGLGQHHVGRGGDLEVGRVTGDGHDPASPGLHQAGIVGGFVTVPVGIHA